MATAGLVAGSPPAGFLSRVTNLEREVNFLKQKVEDDARWKFLLEKWILDNFAFDVRGALLAKEKGIGGGCRQSKDRKREKEDGEQNSRSSKVREERRHGEVKRVSQQIKKCPRELEDGTDGGGDDGHDENEDNRLYYNDEGMEVNVDPRDLIILPDCPSGSDEDDHRSLNNSTYESDFEGDETKNIGDSESESDDPEPKKYKKMEWTLQGSYSNLETLKENFNMRDWALWTTSKVANGKKILYYCKMCRKNGPGRLMLKFMNDVPEVEIYKNQLEHDHSRKVRMTEETKSEIFNLYKAGMKNSTHIINSFKISKPDLRVPSPRQVSNVLKSHKRKEKKFQQASRAQAQADKPKKMKKMSMSKREGNADVAETNPAVDTSSSSQHFQSPHTQTVSGFNANTSTPVHPTLLTSFSNPVAPVYQHSTYDTTGLHILHQQFHSL